MKHRFTFALLLAAAILAGLLMPLGAMTLLDERISQPEAVVQERLSLEEGSWRNRSIAQKLKILQSWEYTTSPLGFLDDTVEYQREASKRTELLTEFFESMPAIEISWADYDLVYLTQEDAFAVWNVWLRLDNGFYISFMVDEETDAILSCYFYGYDADIGLDAIFDALADQANTMESFEVMLGQRLGAFLKKSLGATEATYDPEARLMRLVFPEETLDVRCEIYPGYGVLMFNPSPSDLYSLTRIEDATVRESPD